MDTAQCPVRNLCKGGRMRKHQFVKEDCNCVRKASYFRCKHCGAMEYKSLREIRALGSVQASCSCLEAPQVPPQEVFKGLMGGTFDCLSPDYETYAAAEKEKQHSDALGQS